MTTVLVAGSGPLSQKEADDLLDDFFEPGNNVLVAPGDTKRHTKAVRAVVDAVLWDDMILVVPDGETEVKNAPEYVSYVVDGPTLLDVIEDEEEEVDLLLISVPEPDSGDYEEIVELVDAALAREVPVKDLTKGLDDISLEDVPEPDVEESVADQVIAEELPKGIDVPLDVDRLLSGDDATWEQQLLLAVAAAQLALIELGNLISARVEAQEKTEPEEEPTDAERALGWRAVDVPADAPKKTTRRGRPRTNVGEKQIERDGEWVSRPRGRVKKGTPTRTVHVETGEVLEEGVEGQ